MSQETFTARGGGCRREEIFQYRKARIRFEGVLDVSLAIRCGRARSDCTGRSRKPSRERPTANPICKASGKSTTAPLRPEYHDAKHLDAGRPERRRRRRDPVLCRPRASSSAQISRIAPTADPLNSCYLPGVPRIMYMEHPFQIFQTAEHLAITFEWSQVIDSSIRPGNRRCTKASSRGWATRAAAGKATCSSSKRPTTTTAPGSMLPAPSTATRCASRSATRCATPTRSTTQRRSKTRTCSSGRGRFACRCTAKPICRASTSINATPRRGGERCVRARSTHGYPAPIPAETCRSTRAQAAAGAAGSHRRDSPRARRQARSLRLVPARRRRRHYGLESSPQIFLTPASRGSVVDPATASCPTRRGRAPSATAREEPHRGYDDPTAHCFVAGIPRSHYVPQPVQILQPPGFLVVLFERMSWRHIALNPRPALRTRAPVARRLQRPLGGRHARRREQEFQRQSVAQRSRRYGQPRQTVVERFTPVDEDTLIYRATVTDPIPYTRPWTIEVPMHRMADELLEVACREDNADLEHLKHVRDEYRAAQGQEN